MITVSFHNGNVSGDLVRAQKAVFDHFGRKDHLQIHTELPHGAAIDEYLNTRFWDEIAIFDIDCIPMNPVILLEAEEKAKEGRLFGIEQSANHLGNERYVGAPFICFGRSLWESIGKPSFKETKTEDVAGFVTRCAYWNQKKVEYLSPIACEEPRWKLPDGTVFGLGTTYEGYIYHAFESRFQHGSTSRFIEKCKEVINGKG
jgi:hypothetical protein